MASLDIVPSPGLNAAVLEHLRRSRVREGAGPAALMRSLVANLDEPEASLLPYVWNLILPLLVGDRERLRLAANVAVSLDLFESSGPLVALARRTGDVHLMLAAASLSANPAITESVVQSAAELATLAPPEIQSALLLRLSPSSSLAAKHPNLYAQTWPGSEMAGRESVAPIVAVEERGGNAIEYWRFLCDLLDAGAAVRRIPQVFSRQPVQDWLAQNTPTVIWNQDLIRRLRDLGWSLSNVVAPTGLKNARERILLMQRISNVVPGQLRPISGEAHRPSMADPLDPTVFQTGTFDAMELAYLGGGSVSSVYNLSRDDVLTPRRHAATGGLIWAFSQVVAFRTWRFLTAAASSRPRRALLENLERMAQSRKVAIVAVSSGGSLLREGDGGFFDVETGQQVFSDVIVMDEIFQPFEIGGGHVPHLLAPSDRVSVHPSRLGGAPALSEHRISARGIAELERKHNWAAVLNAYPDVEEDLLMEGLGIGENILAKS